MLNIFTGYYFLKCHCKLLSHYLEGPGNQQDRVPRAFPVGLESLGILEVRETIRTYQNGDRIIQ